MKTSCCKWCHWSGATTRMTGRASPPWDEQTISFFSKRPYWQVGSPAGPSVHPKEIRPQQTKLQLQTFPPPLREIREILDQLPMPCSTFLALQMNLTLLPCHASKPVGGRTQLFAPNWTRLTQDVWALDTRPPVFCQQEWCS